MTVLGVEISGRRYGMGSLADDRPARCKRLSYPGTSGNPVSGRAGPERHRAVGNRRFEGVVVGGVGRLHLEQGELSEAQACLQLRLAVTRETGDRRIQGLAHRSQGALFTCQGRLDQARVALAAGESVLRQLGDKLYLALVLCARAELERLSGDVAVARASCDEADAVAAGIQTGPQSGLGRKLAALRESLNGASAPC